MSVDSAALMITGARLLKENVAADERNDQNETRTLNKEMKLE